MGLLGATSECPWNLQPLHNALSCGKPRRLPWTADISAVGTAASEASKPPVLEWARLDVLQARMLLEMLRTLRDEDLSPFGGF